MPSFFCFSCKSKFKSSTAFCKVCCRPLFKEISHIQSTSFIDAKDLDYFFVPGQYLEDGSILQYDMFSKKFLDFTEFSFITHCEQISKVFSFYFQHFKFSQTYFDMILDIFFADEKGFCYIMEFRPVHRFGISIKENNPNNLKILLQNHFDDVCDLLNHLKREYNEKLIRISKFEIFMSRHISW